MVHKSIIALFVLFCINAALFAQNNVPANVSMKVEEFTYKKPSVGKIGLSVLVAASDPTTLLIPAKEMTPHINEAIAATPTYIPWVSTYAGGGSADYTLSGRITNAETKRGDNKPMCIITVDALLTDNRTGKTVAEKRVYGSGMGFGTFTDMEGIKAMACKNLTYHLCEFVFEALPITGTVLEKGVEKTNGDVNERQCYVDLGEKHGVYKDLVLYVTDGSKYKGELKVKEVMGDDICACKITKGSSFIEKALESGSKIIVTSKPKKM